MRYAGSRSAIAVWSLLWLVCAGAVAGDVPTLDELLAINATNRARFKAGEIVYVLNRQDAPGHLQEMEEQREAEVRRRIKEHEREPASQQREAILAVLEDQLAGAHLMAVVLHTLRYGSFRLQLRFDEGRNRALSIKEDDRDLVAILEKAGAKNDGRFGFYPRIQTLREGDRVTTVYDCCNGTQTRSPGSMPCARLTEEEILDFGFFSLAKFPDPKRFTHEITQDKAEANIVQVRFTKRRKPLEGLLRPPLHIIYRLDRDLGYRVVQCEKRVGEKLADNKTFTYMRVNGELFLKSRSYVKYDEHGKEEERGTWTVQSCRLVPELPDTAFQLERK